MDERLYRFLKWTALVMALGWVGWSAYDFLLRGKEPGEVERAAAARYFADGHYEQALQSYERALEINPDLLAARWGMAETLIKLQREGEAISLYDELISLKPEMAALYANRGIAHDLLGEPEAALADYDRALALDEEIGEGPGLMTRFLRNQPEKPPGIAARADYLRAQLALPPGQRVLRDPELDQAQRPYKH